MRFDADAYLKALELPVFTAGGRSFTGRLLSFEEWVALEGRLSSWRAGALNYAQIKRLLRDLMDAMFPPPPPPPLWRRLFLREKREGSAADELERLPMPVQLEAIKDFIDSQGNALKAVLPAPGEEGEE